MKMHLTYFALSHIYLNDGNFRVVAQGLGDVDDNVEERPLKTEVPRESLTWSPDVRGHPERRVLAWVLHPAQTLGHGMSGPGVSMGTLRMTESP